MVAYNNVGDLGFNALAVTMSAKFSNLDPQRASRRPDGGFATAHCAGKDAPYFHG
jgi:hypothetical protein